MGHQWRLTWFSYETDRLLGDIDLAITDADVRRMFALPEELDDLTGAFPVTADQRSELVKLSAVDIELGAYAYFVEAYAL